MDYILFSHFQIGQQGDKDAYDPKRPHDAGANARSLVTRHAGRLKTLLASETRRRGLLVLFYDAGWTACLRDLERAYTTARENREIEFGEAVCSALKDELNHLGLGGYVRVVGARHVFEFFKNASGQAARDMFKWFTGRSPEDRTPQLLFDAPKVIDAILRIRSIENSVPVFRIDQDVLFPGGGRWTVIDVDDAQADLSFKKLTAALEEALVLFRHLQENPNVGRAIFSCAYEHPPKDSKDMEVWSRAFATRIDPARDTAAIHQCSQAEKFFGITWDTSADGWRLDGPNHDTLTSIGAHPLRGVISGALMFLSPGLLIDLPPFSNTAQNVMWIDDHLRWAVHKALDHLEGMPDDPWDGVRPSLSKWRHPASDPGAATEDAHRYFVALLLGCVFDRWVLRTPAPKLSDEEARHLGIARHHLPPGAPGEQPTDFIRLLRNAIERSVEPDDPAEKRGLRKALEEEALERIRTVARIWSQLDGTLVFEWLFPAATTPLAGAEAAPQSLFERDSRAEAIFCESGGRGLSTLTLSEVRESLNPRVLESLQILISDAIDYISWAVAWPKVMHMIRVAPPGSFAGDVVSHPSDG